MMEQLILYWTGVAIWGAVCFAVAASVIACALIAPAVVFVRSSRKIWKWRIGAAIAKHGLDQEDVRFAVAVPSQDLPGGATTDQLLAWAERVKERAEVARKM